MFDVNRYQKNSHGTVGLLFKVIKRAGHSDPNDHYRCAC